jgi:NADPH:quinone reductase-like Zn-dependent oxidoreductase
LAVSQGSSAAHWLGTDDTGRDIASRLLYGARPSLLAPLAVALGAGLLGTALAVSAAWIGGWWDRTVTALLEVGEGVEGVVVGDRVFGEGADTYAEFAVLSAWARMPEGLAFEVAAGYPSVVETALRIIREVGVRPGQTLLVSGASGGVGSAVLQIARERGITVIGTAGAANQDYLRGLGALATTYNEGWVERVRHLGRVDAALDLAGSGVIRELVELTGDPRKVVSIADLGAPQLGVRFSGVAGSVPDALAEAVDLISRGRLHIPVEKSYALAQAAAAHADSRAGHTRGRRVLVI